MELPYSRKCWQSLNLAVWAANDIFHTIQDLNFGSMVWYRHMYVHARGKKFGGLKAYRQTAKFNSPSNFPVIRYLVS